MTFIAMQFGSLPALGENCQFLGFPEYLWKSYKKVQIPETPEIGDDHLIPSILTLDAHSINFFLGGLGMITKMNAIYTKIVI